MEITLRNLVAAGFFKTRYTIGNKKRKGRIYVFPTRLTTGYFKRKSWNAPKKKKSIEVKMITNAAVEPFSLNIFFASKNKTNGITK
jgi:hypothetical protein